MNTQWKDMSPMEKIALIISCISAFIVALALRKADSFSVDIICPAIAIATAFDALAAWKRNRKLAYLLIAAAVISLAFFILDQCLF